MCTLLKCSFVPLSIKEDLLLFQEKQNNKDLLLTLPTLRQRSHSDLCDPKHPSTSPPQSQEVLQDTFVKTHLWYCREPLNQIQLNLPNCFPKGSCTQMRKTSRTGPLAWSPPGQYIQPAQPTSCQPRPGHTRHLWALGPSHFSGANRREVSVCAKAHRTVQHPSAPFEQHRSKARMLVQDSKHWEMCGSSVQKLAQLPRSCHGCVSCCREERQGCT